MLNRIREEKEKDYNYIVRNIEGAQNIDHIATINNMINLFNIKWEVGKSNKDIIETIELRGLLKYKEKNLDLQNVII